MTHHRRGLRRLLRDDELLAEIEADSDQANGLNERQCAMLVYAIKLTREPASMDRSDVEALQNVGFSDLDILHIAEVTSYYAYVNRIVDGLGVVLEDE